MSLVFARWTGVSQTGGSATASVSANAKKASLAAMDNLSEADTWIYDALDYQVLEVCYQRPPPEAYLDLGERRATASEVDAMAAAAGRSVDDYLDWTCWPCYDHLRVDGQVGPDGWPQLWPRVLRRQRDPEVQRRRTKVKHELLRLVLEVLGENSAGPALSSQQLGWKELPLKGPGTLSAYLLKRFSLLWKIINEKVTNDFARGSVAITAATRNNYLTTLLSPPMGPKVAKSLLDAVWRHVERFSWVSEYNITYDMEVEWLRQQQ